jgi:hypothetical protein
MAKKQAGLLIPASWKMKVGGSRSKADSGKNVDFSKNKLEEKGWRCGSSAQCPEFNGQYCQKTNQQTNR